MKIENDLVVLDVESTGVWVERDKVIEIGLIKYRVNGQKEIFHKRINPGMPIPQAVQRLTGITDADVKEAPPFRTVAHSVLEFMADADFGGFNIERFDLPLLEREMAEAGIKFDWKDRRIFDAQKVFHLNEKRDLSAAHQFYCGEELVGAHSALADSEAVYKILEKQVEKYGNGDVSLRVLERFEYEARADFHDQERKFCWWNGKLFLMFGKYARKIPLDELVKADAGYLQWVLAKDFSDNVKSIIRAALNGEIPTRG